MHRKGVLFSNQKSSHEVDFVAMVVLCYCQRLEKGACTMYQEVWTHSTTARLILKVCWTNQQTVAWKKSTPVMMSGSTTQPLFMLSSLVLLAKHVLFCNWP